MIETRNYNTHGDHIERAAIREALGMIEHPAANAPPAILRRLNERRAEMGLPRILSAGERAVIDSRIDDILRDASPAATAAPKRGPVWIDLTKTPSRSTRPTTDYRTTVLLTVGHGLARGHGGPGTAGKRIARDAYGTPDQLNAEAGWILRDGHDGALVAIAGPALRAVPSKVVPLVVQWMPDMSRDDHRELVRRIEAGERGVSANYVVEERRLMKLPEPTEVVTRARLVHVALLPAGDDAAFPGARATVFRRRPDTADELARQVAEVEAAAKWHASEADRRWT
jgi:hypothetical protein